MKPALRNALLLIAALVALVAGHVSYRWFFHPQPEDTGSVMVDFALPDLNGKERWLSEWYGKTIVLNFWATWCGPCRDEMPLLLNVQKQYQDQGVVVIGLAIDDRDSVAAFAKEMRIGYPLLIGEEAGLSLLSRYGNPRGFLPYTVIIRPDGEIAARKLGAYHDEKELTAILDTLVKPDSASILSK